MHIKIVGFKCHIDAYYNFNSDDMILLKGPSGAGKSTILQSIFWCLYGSMSNIYNNTGEIKTCSVTLYINDLIIYRQKRPELLKVTICSTDNIDYEDIVAQNIIEQSFGSKNLWKSCSYIEQKHRCGLLSGSSSEKLELLNQLSFDSDNPKEYIFKIGEELKSANNKFLTCQANFIAELNLFTETITNKPITLNISDHDIEELSNEIKTGEKDVKILYTKVLEHERVQGSYNTLVTQITSCKSQLNNYININYNDENIYIDKINKLQLDITQLKSILNELQSYQNTKMRMETINQKITSIDHQLNTVNIDINKFGLNDIKIIPTNDQIRQSQNQESLRSDYIQECNNLGYKYDQLEIQTVISQLKEQINKVQILEKNITTYQQLKSLQLQLNNNNCNMDTKLLTDDNVNLLETKIHDTGVNISELKKGKELLLCPECDKPLRYIHNKLIKGERDPVTLEEINNEENKYRNLINELNNTRHIINIIKQITLLTQQLNGINLDELENFIKAPSSSIKLQSYLSRLERIQFIDPPEFSSLLLNLLFTKHKLTSEKNNLKDRLKDIVLPILENNNYNSSLELENIIKVKQNEIVTLRNDHQTELKRKINKKQLEDTLLSYQNQKKTLELLLNPGINDKYKLTTELLNNNKIKYEKAIYGKSMFKKQKELELKREEVMKLNKDVLSLQRLKHNSINVECKQLQDTVDNINTVMEDILPIFFDEPIIMKLQLYKVLKTKKLIKPGLNISIKYDGIEYDDVKQMSGGEGDRISLALILSLNQVSNSPIILLDECISSLDGSLKESCINAMKKIKNKTIICVDHEAVEGFYDKVIHLKK